jgi:S1-C subfamily serine protease
MQSLLLALTLANSCQAPVPKAAPPDPRGYPYVGVMLSNTRQDGGPLRIDPPLPGTPAALAGLMGGDLLVRLGDIELKSFNQMADTVLDLRPGARALMVVIRDNEVHEIWLTLGLRPPPPDYPEPDFSRKSIYPPVPK